MKAIAIAALALSFTTAAAFARDNDTPSHFVANTGTQVHATVQSNSNGQPDGNAPAHSQHAGSHH
jgi:hypothetical protein